MADFRVTPDRKLDMLHDPDDRRTAGTPTSWGPK